MKKGKVKLKRIFGSEMAQHDPNFTKYSVKRFDLLDELLAKENDLLIVNAARGSGKSGLLIEFEKLLKQESSNNVVLKKFYADMALPKQEISVSEGIDFWKNILLGRIVSHVGSDKSFALTDDDMSAVEMAEFHGEKPLNIISSVLKRVKFKGSIIDKCQFDSNLSIETLTRIVQRSDKTYWLLLDEMDDIYDNKDGINILIGLLQASSYISSKFSNIRIRLTIRPHIMTYLRISNGTIQKLSECELKIYWNKEQLRKILSNRLAFYEYQQVVGRQAEFELSPTEELCKNKEVDIIQRYFEDFDMSFSPDSSSDYRAFGTLCFYRPRWMIEFCKEVYSLTFEGVKACHLDYKRAFVPFGNRRIQFLLGEFSKTFVFLQDAISGLVGTGSQGLGKSKKLRSSIINRLLKTKIIEVEESKEFQKALEIARALYQVEFLRAKQIIPGVIGKKHRFLYFTERPDLLTNWQHEPDILWEIHPTFAKAFNIIDSNAYEIGGEVKLVGERQPPHNKPFKQDK